LPPLYPFPLESVEKIPYTSLSVLDSACHVNAILKFRTTGNDERVLIGFYPNSQNYLPFQAMNGNIYVIISIYMFISYFNSFRDQFDGIMGLVYNSAK